MQDLADDVVKGSEVSQFCQLQHRARAALVTWKPSRSFLTVFAKISIKVETGKKKERISALIVEGTFGGVTR